MPKEGAPLTAASGLDEFVTEKYAAQIGVVLDKWQEGLLENSPRYQLFDKVAPGFSAAPFRPVEVRQVRSGVIEVVHKTFAAQPSLGRADSLSEFKAETNHFTKIITADFQVTSISEQSAGKVQTRILYELVGSGTGFHREQRVGWWEIEWAPAGGEAFQPLHWRTIEETVSRSAVPVFVDISAQALGSNHSYSAQLLHGSDHWRTVLDGASGIDIYGHNGVSVSDIDGDGFDDLYVCQGAGLPNRLYRNRRDGTFEDITEGSGLGILDNTVCAVFADIDNDGRQDVIVVRNDGPALFINQGTGRFVEQHDAFRFANAPQGTFTGAAIADYDRDGWLDIYFCLYSYYQGADQYKYPGPYYDANNGPPNFMMRNQRDRTFRDVTAESGLNQNNTRYSFCCGWNDFDHDGWPDLYVVNDFGRKNLYRNNGNGTFTDVAASMGVEDTGAGMSVCWSDFDNDGKSDLYVGNMWTAAGQHLSEQPAFQKDSKDEIRQEYRKHAMGNSLFHNDGSGFRDATASAGVGNGRWAWSSDALDFDHDGFADLYVTNGMVSGPSREDLNGFFWRRVVAKSPDGQKASRDYELGWNAINELLRADGTWSGKERNVFFANSGDGTFADVSGAIGLDFREDGRAFALSDFNHDGRPEIFLKNRNGPQFRILANVVENLPPSIIFCLNGVKSNRDAIGAEVSIETSSGKQTRCLQAGSGFLSQHSKELFFGLGKADEIRRAMIAWPSGLTQEFRDLPINHRIWIEEGRPEPLKVEPFKPLRRNLSVAESYVENLPTAVETWLLDPVSAPNFSLPDSTGKAITLTSLRGKPALLNFWVAGSDDCQQNLQVFSQYRSQLEKIGGQILTLNCNSDFGQAGAWLSNHKISVPVLRASDDVMALYNLIYRYLFDRHRDITFPVSFLLDKDSQIVKVYQGVISADHLPEDFQSIPRNDAERRMKGLPFAGSGGFQFRRNYLSYGSVFFRYGFPQQSLDFFQRALRDDPTSAEALYGVGSVYLDEYDDQSHTERARQVFEQVLTLRASYPDTFPNTWNNLGILATREHNMSEAVGYFERALVLNHDHLIALDNLGNAYRELKQWDKARQTLEHAVQVGPEDPEANYSLGMVFAQTDDAKQARDYLLRALSYRPVYPAALNNLGILYLRNEQRDEAVASFKKSIEVAPGFDHSYLNLAQVYLLEGKNDEARQILQQLLANHPNHKQGLEMLQQIPAKPGLN